MIFEILSSVLVGGLVGSTYLYRRGLGGNDTQKIVRIAANTGLIAKDGKEIRIHRRTTGNGYVEYVFQLPQGLSSKQFQEKLDRFQDGLNAKTKVLDISLTDLKAINWKRDILNQVQELMNKKKTLRKEVELSFDGMLKFKVWTESLTNEFYYDINLIKKMKDWQVPVGTTRNGVIKHDFEKKAHIIVAGTTDFGKSNWVNCTINTLLLNKPEDVSFTLIDLKGGLEFNRYRKLKQVRSYATNVEEAKEALQSAVSKMDEITAYLLDKGYSNVKEAGFNGRHFIVIDEAADMADEKECQDFLKDIARKGRASGLRLIYTTQYPTTETISSQVKRNCIGRLCFVLDTATASTVVLDQPGAEKLPPIQGRALYKDLGLIEVQTPLITNDDINKITHQHITFRARKDEDYGNNEQRATTRKHTLELEEIGLS